MHGGDIALPAGASPAPSRGEERATGAGVENTRKLRVKFMKFMMWLDLFGRVVAPGNRAKVIEQMAVDSRSGAPRRRE
jgi:hypothetical protein